MSALAVNPWLRAMPAVFVLIWSTGFIVAKYGLPHAPPLSFLVFRYLFSILCFGIWIGISRPLWPASRSQWLHLAVTGLLMHGGYLGGVWVAISHGMGSGLAALIVRLREGEPEVPAHEQLLCAGAGLMNFLNALYLMGYAAKTLSGAALRDPALQAAFCQPGEQLLAWVLAGTPSKPAAARQAAADAPAVLSDWVPPTTRAAG